MGPDSSRNNTEMQKGQNKLEIEKQKREHKMETRCYKSGARSWLAKIHRRVVQWLLPRLGSFGPSSLFFSSFTSASEHVMHQEGEWRCNVPEMLHQAHTCRVDSSWLGTRQRTATATDAWAPRITACHSQRSASPRILDAGLLMSSPWQF